MMPGWYSLMSKASFFPHRHLYGVNASAKTADSPIDQMVVALERREPQTQRMHVECQYPLGTVFHHVAESECFLSRDGRSSNQRFREAQ
jgi:hypothetical protein